MANKPFIPVRPNASTLDGFVMQAWNNDIYNCLVGSNVPSAIKTATFTCNMMEWFYPIDSTAGAMTAYLPPAIGIRGKKFKFKKIAGGGTVTLSGSGTDSFDGSGAPGTATALTGFQQEYCSDGVNNWWRVA